MTPAVPARPPRSPETRAERRARRQLEASARAIERGTVTATTMKRRARHRQFVGKTWS